MTRTARSIFVFGIYLVGTGLVLFAVPNVLLGWLRLAPAREPWIRVLGVPVGLMGAMYVSTARQNVVPFFRTTVWSRTAVLVGFALLALLRLAPPILIAFGLIDAAGAMWTRAALRSDAA